ncbi:MAG TPA: creatininase family protein [Candidatus Binatia bacterium]|nr:creatininase family protein [Candidatus Binatia bacterium]
MEDAGRDGATRARREWKHLTGADFARMDRARTIVMVTCSPLEVHGPHLPVVTDNLEAESLSIRTMELLHERDRSLEFVHLPPLYVAADVLPHPGSVMFRSSTITRVLGDLGRSLAKQGFVHIWVASFHGGPRHFIPIEVACERTNRRYGTKMLCAFSLLINRLTRGGSELSSILGHIDGVTAADLRGDHHGGAIETSMMLHLAGDRVDARYRQLAQRTLDGKRSAEGLPPLPAGGVLDLVKSFKHKLKYYETETYSGKPAIASAAIGREMIDVLARHSADALAEVLGGTLPLAQCHSPIWPLRWLFTTEWLSRAFERAVGYRQSVF